MSDMLFDGKSALSCWGLSLDSCYISAAKRKTYWLDVPAGDGKLDAMRGLGDPVYEMRTLTATFSIPRYRRDDIIAKLQRDFAGREIPIVSPDNTNYYYLGEIRVKGSAVDEIVIEATVYPWRFAQKETVHTIPATSDAVAYVWYNEGSRAVVPELTVSGSYAKIAVDGNTVTLLAGTYNLSEFRIPGNSSITVTVIISVGTLTARYRETIL